MARVTNGGARSDVCGGIYNGFKVTQKQRKNDEEKVKLIKKSDG